MIYFFFVFHKKKLSLQSLSKVLLLSLKKTKYLKIPFLAFTFKHKLKMFRQNHQCEFLHRIGTCLV